MELELRRRFFAEELEAVCRLQSPRLVDAFAAVPRERFLRAGPWTVIADSGESAVTGATPVRTQPTPDDDPARVYHNIAVAIDVARELFNGQPATLAIWIDTLSLTPGARVLHIGAGLGYYTAVMAEAVGPGGRVVGYEVDPALAGEARRNLASRPWVEVRAGDGAEALAEHFDAVLVNAGVTHPLETWLDALAPGGRMVLPLTATMPAMGTHIGKGLVVLVTKNDAHDLGARVVSFVAVYSAIGIRDPQMNERISKALMAGPSRWRALTRVRRDPHEPSDACWLHGTTCCLSTL